MVPPPWGGNLKPQCVTFLTVIVCGHAHNRVHCGQVREPAATCCSHGVSARDSQDARFPLFSFVCFEKCSFGRAWALQNSACNFLFGQKIGVLSAPSTSVLATAARQSSLHAYMHVAVPHTRILCLSVMYMHMPTCMPKRNGFAFFFMCSCAYFRPRPRNIYCLGDIASRCNTGGFTRALFQCACRNITLNTESCPPAAHPRQVSSCLLAHKFGKTNRWYDGAFFPNIAIGCRHLRLPPQCALSVGIDPWVRLDKRLFIVCSLWFQFVPRREGRQILWQLLLLFVFCRRRCQLPMAVCCAGPQWQAAFHTGPQPPAHDGSVPHWATASNSRWQCSPPDLDRELPTAVC